MWKWQILNWVNELLFFLYLQSSESIELVFFIKFSHFSLETTFHSSLFFFFFSNTFSFRETEPKKKKEKIWKLLKCFIIQITFQKSSLCSIQTEACLLVCCRLVKSIIQEVSNLSLSMENFSVKNVFLSSIQADSCLLCFHFSAVPFLSRCLSECRLADKMILCEHIVKTLTNFSAVDL